MTPRIETIRILREKREWSRDLDSLRVFFFESPTKINGKMWEEIYTERKPSIQFNHRSQTHGIFNHPYVPFDKGKLLSFVYDVCIGLSWPHAQRGV